MTIQSQASNINPEIETAITHNPHLLKNKLHFNPKNGKVVLQGSVSSYFEKQMAQEALRNVAGVGEIQNELTVDWN